MHVHMYEYKYIHSCSNDICSLFSENISELWFKIFTVVFPFTDPSVTKTIKFVDSTTVKTT